MAGVTENTVLVRQVQGLALLLSWLPQGSKTRELMSLALETDAHGTLDSISGPEDADSFEGLHDWFESHWTRDDISDAEKRIVDWQADGDNMRAVVDEIRGIESKLGA